MIDTQIQNYVHNTHVYVKKNVLQILYKLDNFNDIRHTEHIGKVSSTLGDLVIFLGSHINIRATIILMDIHNLFFCLI